MAECSVRLAEYSVSLAEYSVRLAEYSVSLAECSVRLAECSVRLAECSVRLTKCSVRLAECSVRLAECSVRLAECSVRLTHCCTLYEMLSTDYDSHMSAAPKLSQPTFIDPRKDPAYRKVVEVVRGVRMMSPRPALPHAVVASRLHQLIGYKFGDDFGGPTDEGPGGWWILYETELHLERDDPVVPDLVGWRRERQPRFTEGVGITVAPDWLCEVLSPSTAVWDRTAKLPLYREHGVAHVWLVDPLACTVEVFRLTTEGYLLLTYGGAQSMRAEPFEAISIDLARLWPPRLSA